MFLYFVKRTTTTYTLSRSAAAVDEGTQFTFTLTTTGVDDGTTVPYTITGISSADIGGAALTGVFTIVGGVGAVTLTATADLTTEGAETATLSLDGGLGSLSIGINDTSVTEVFVDAVELGDPYWTNVSTHLTFDDEILDKRNPSRTFINNGVSYSSSPAKFGKSGYFSGYSVKCMEDLLNFGSGDFTVEMWIYPTNTSAYTEFIRSNSDFLFRSTPTRQLQFESSLGTLTTSANVINVNTWYHVALTRNGNTFSIWRNGSQVATATLTGTLAGATRTEIGAINDVSEPFIGYMDELRITTGVARYTSNFTAPRRRFPSYQSTDPYALHVEALVPFNSTAPLSDLTGRIVNQWTGALTTSTTDYAMGNASGVFNGSTIVQVGSDSSLGLGNGNFTIELYINITAGANLVGKTVLCQTINTHLQELFLIYVVNQSVILYMGDGSAQYNIINQRAFTTTAPAGVWRHYAIVRNGNTITWFYHGQPVGSVTTSATFASTTNPILLGGRNVSGAPNQMFTGKIDAFRVTKAARYTEAFTPPTAYNL